MYWDCWGFFALLLSSFWKGFSEREGACLIFAVVGGKPTNNNEKVAYLIKVFTQGRL